MVETEQPRAQWGERTPADLASLLVELGRAVRGVSFYGDEAAACVQLMDRTWLAFRGELDRAGPVEIWLVESGFRATGINDEIPLRHLQDLASALERHEIHRVRFAHGLTRDALRAFLELLSRSAASIRQEGGMTRALSHRSSAGILLNGGEDAAVAAHTPLRATPAVATSSLGSALLARSHQLIVEHKERAEKPALDDQPLEAATSDDRSERLLFRLIELDRCSDDAAYEFLGRRIVEWARELYEGGLRDECHRAVLVLADHAVGDGGRSGLQARIAQRLFEELASGPRLESLIDRAISTNPAVSIRATQVLLQLGEHAIPALFARIAGDPDSDASAQLCAVMIALGEPAIAELTTSIGHRDDARALLAIRLAGELQHPALVKPILAALEGPRPALHREAARALAQIGGDQAVHGLMNALSSERPGLPELSAHCLGVLRDPRAVQPLLAALERARRNGDGQRAREMIRAMGAVGHERAVPRLAALLERNPVVLRRRLIHDLQIAALVALDAIPCREARRAIERAEKHRDPGVRARARQILAKSHAESKAAS